jgi:hypothetical protein
MSEFSFRAEGLDVEQIMRQIRARIRDKRGVDYTDQQIHELATAKLERFLDPKGVRSDLLERYRQHRVASATHPPSYAFEDTTLFESDKPLVRFIRRLLRPLLKMFFNYNALTHVLHTQTAINHHWTHVHDTRDEQELLAYEVMHNLVLETTRLGIDVKNMKMRVESIASRLEFNERRARALEGVVQFKPDAKEVARPTIAAGTEPAGGTDPITGGESLRTRRRRRRRGRRSGQGMAGPSGGPSASDQPVSERAMPVDATPDAAAETSAYPGGSATAAPEPREPSRDEAAKPTPTTGKTADPTDQ